ncbi:hypothetical protein [Micromonospora sp. NBC_01813]|uniref:hypothetical protein n=1 Tax=Micromonospora sp. NBC_01813 TaxID=2975988 RepID=UPI002DD812CA|nr:hypothetical protein [Micromonospora sp. NBC_01813]WSA07720.1 hypothetical protein OG958_26375 [Micromonospora sp. NBC_01813]
MRRRTSTYRSRLVLVVQAVVLLLLAAPAAAAPSDGPIPPRNVPAETGKYYVAGPPVDGQREFLYAIAAKTLGDGNRYREIFTLNEGRPQPDGQQMVDATTVEPGWILILPADATGPDVRTGALPELAAAGDPAPPTGDSGDWSSTGLRIALLVLAVLLVVWARVTLMARRGPRPVQAAEQADDQADDQATDQADEQPADQAGFHAAESVSQAGADPEPTIPPPPTAEPPPTTAPPPTAPDTTAGGQVTRTITTPWRAAAQLPDLDAAVLLPPTPPNPFAALVTELNCGDRSAWVRLIGARPARWGSAYGWLSAGRRPPPSTAALILGERDGMRLWVDLARAPDALTIVGDPEAARRHAVTLVAQLRGDTDVVVAGDALGDDLPEVARWVPAVADIGANRSTARMQVVVCSAGDATALREPLRQLVRDGRHAVPLIVGQAPAARWSIRTGAAGTGPGLGEPRNPPGEPGRAHHDQPSPSPAHRP